MIVTCSRVGTRRCDLQFHTRATLTSGAKCTLYIREFGLWVDFFSNLNAVYVLTLYHVPPLIPVLFIDCNSYKITRRPCSVNMRCFEVVLLHHLDHLGPAPGIQYFCCSTRPSSKGRIPSLVTYMKSLVGWKLPPLVCRVQPAYCRTLRHKMCAMCGGSALVKRGLDVIVLGIASNSHLEICFSQKCFV